MKEHDYILKPSTRVLYYLIDREEYILTNQDGRTENTLRIFTVDRDGSVTMQGCRLGSYFASDPYLLFELKDIHSTYGEVNPGYFGRRSA